MGAFVRAWSYVKVSWSVLVRDPSIAVFPLLSMFAVLLIMVPFVVGNWSMFAVPKGSAPVLSSSQYAEIFLLYLACSFIIVFTNSAMVACASICLSGGTATVAEGFGAAVNNLPRIILWSMIAGTVGFLLSAFRRRDSGVINQIVIWILGAAWTAATFFIIPVIVLEQCDIFTAFTRSAELFKRLWGEAVVGSGGVGVFFLPFWLAPFLLVFLILELGGGSSAAILPMLAICGIYCVLVGAAQSALQEIFVVVAYQHASGTGSPQGIDAQLVTGAFSSGEFRVSN